MGEKGEREAMTIYDRDRVASRLGDAVYRYEMVPGPDRRWRNAG